MNIGILALTPEGQKLALKIASLYRETGYLADVYLPHHLQCRPLSQEEPVDQVRQSATGPREPDREKEYRGVPGTVKIFFYEEKLKEVVSGLFPRYRGLVFIMAAGIVVRVIAPLIKDKKTDPAVVVMDEKGRFTVPVLSGHLGGANFLAGKLARLTGAVPVITTATDVQGKKAPDVLAREYNLAIEPWDHLAKINSQLARDGNLGWFIEPELARYMDLPLDNSCDSGDIPVGKFWGGGDNFVDNPGSFVEKPVNNLHRSVDSLNKSVDISVDNCDMFVDNPKFLPIHCYSAGGLYDGVVLLTNRILPPAHSTHLFLRPRNLLIGVGCRKGTPAQAIIKAISQTLAQGGFSPGSLAKIASVEIKQDEPGLHEAARYFQVPLEFYSLEAIRVAYRQWPGLAKSEYVQKQIGVDGVCEPAALLGGKKTSLLLKKQRFPGVTTALAVDACWW